ncbi:MAG: hypothetical protein AB7F65_10320 [Dehalococcoidia bacterium]
MQHQELPEGRTGRRTLTRTARIAGLGLLAGLSTLLLVACSEEEPEAEATASTTASAEATTAAAGTSEATSSAATDGTTITVAAEGDLAPYLVGPEGLTLYIFTNDTEGVSNCADQCIANWPPLLVDEGVEPTASDDAPGELGVIEREDGLGRQVTYDGMPLYYWVGDTAPGQTTGHEVGGVWFVATPTGDAAAAAGGSAAGASEAVGATTISVATEGDLAPYLVGPEGLTLYLFTNDTTGVSNCADQCAVNWPPLLVDEGVEPTASPDAPGELGVIEREDGLGRQVTYDGMPLYYWAGDTAPGQTTGHEVGGVWFVVPPTGGTAAAIGGDGPGY